MRLRQAKKLVKHRHLLQAWAPGPERDRRAIRRFLRWPGRPSANFPLEGLRSGHYVLDQLGRPKKFTGDLLDWSLIHSIEHRVDLTELADGTCISTVFLGIDHNFGDMLHMRGGRHTPVLFESMVQLPGEKWDEQHRYTNLHQARVGHALLIARLSSPTVPETHEGDPRFSPRMQKLYRRLAERSRKQYQRLERLRFNGAMRAAG